MSHYTQMSCLFIGAPPLAMRVGPSLERLRQWIGTHAGLYMQKFCLGGGGGGEVVVFKKGGRSCRSGMLKN